MGIKTLAFAAMGIASVCVHVVHAIMHRRRLKAYRALLTGETGEKEGLDG